MHVRIHVHQQSVCPLSFLRANACMSICVCMNKDFACSFDFLWLCVHTRHMITGIAARRCMYVCTFVHRCMYVCMHVHDMSTAHANTQGDACMCVYVFASFCVCVCVYIAQFQVRKLKVRTSHKHGVHVCQIVYLLTFYASKTVVLMASQEISMKKVFLSCGKSTAYI